MYVSMDGIDIFHCDPFVRSPLTREIGLFTGEIEIFTGLFKRKIGLFTLLIELFDPINRGFCL